MSRNSAAMATQPATVSRYNTDPMFLLPFLILAQAIPALRTETATVSGVLRTSSGSPAAGIRVAATALPDPADPTPASALVSITETDAEGRYRLENIPAGRYYITAGRVDLPTYYPGTVDVAPALPSRSRRALRFQEWTSPSGIKAPAAHAWLHQFFS